MITQKVSKINPSPLVAKFSIIHRRFLHSMRVDRRFVECKKKNKQKQKQKKQKKEAEKVKSSGSLA